MEILINNRELDGDLSRAVKDAFGQIIDQLNELNLSSLQYIVVPDDFGKELIEFQKKYSLREGYTNNEFGIAMGKVLTYLDNGDFKTSIFFDPRIIFTLFDESLKNNSIHLIHHEFCHVHDDYIKFNAFGVTDIEQIFFNTTDRVSLITYAHADLIWSEYIATRLSATSKPEDHDMYIESLLSFIPQTKEQCEELIKTYRIEGDIDHLFGEMQLITSLLIKVSAYFIGYCHGYKIEPPEDLNKFVKQFSYLDGVWEELSDILHKLFESYGVWEEVNVFSQLADTVLKLWGNLGIYPKNQRGHLYISVP